MAEPNKQLYDVLVTVPLDWPSLTVDWLPGEYDGDLGASTFRMLIGTHTSETTRERLVVVDVTLPTDKRVPRADLLEDLRFKFALLPKGSHGINRMRHMPQSPNLVATCSQENVVYVIDISSVESQVRGTAKIPEVDIVHSCTGIKSVDESWAVDWNRFNAGDLIVGSNNGSVGYWNVTEAPRDNPALHVFPIVSAVNTAKWKDGILFGTACDSGEVSLWDVRTKSSVLSCGRQSESVMSLDFSPHCDTLFASGFVDGYAQIWDTRILRDPLIELRHREQDVSELRWSPISSHILISNCGLDTMVWDLRHVNDEDGALAMVHHSEYNTKDLSVHEKHHLTCNVDDGHNRLQIWRWAHTLTA